MTTTTTGRYCRVRALLLSVGLLVLWSAHALAGVYGVKGSKGVEPLLCQGF